MKSETIITIILIIAGIALFLNWSAGQVKQQNDAAMAYEQCVEEEYGTTPTAWYLTYGEYPSCK